MTHQEVIAAYFASVNGEDWERLAQLFHDDAELHGPGTAPRRGGEAVASYYHDALRPYPVHRDEPTREIYAGDTVTVEIHFEGTLASGRTMAFDAVDVFDFRDDRIARLSSWYDSQRVVALLMEGVAAGAVEGTGLAQLNAARRRWAFGRVRRGAAFRLGEGRWLGLEAEARADALVARAVLLDVPEGPVEAAALEAAAERQRVDVRSGDVLLVRTGGRSPGSGPSGRWVADRGLAAVAYDGPPPDGEAGVPLGAHWALDELARDAAQRGVWDGLLVSLPAAEADGAAHAVVFR
jgi:ketosteroid isomerase-like protein